MATMLDHITPLILTYNEEPNLARVLDRLTWASRIVVLDSFSTDATEAIARSHASVTFAQRKFDDHATQWNYGVALCQTPWVLALDADYVPGPGFEGELGSISPDHAVDAYIASFRYVICGRPLRASLYPPRVVLFSKDTCRFEKDGHTQILRTTGQTARLRSWIDHDDRKPLSRWFASQDNYAKLEAEKLSCTPLDTMLIQDRLRHTMLLGPIVIFFYTLLVRGTLFDGWRGWHYTFQRTLAEMILSLYLLEKKMKDEQ